MNTQLKKYFRTILFSDDFEVEDINNFSFEQSRLIFENYAENGAMKFDKENNTYKVKFEKSENFSNDKIPLLLPIRNMPGLLKYTLNNLISNDAEEIVNIIVIDDRSELDLKSIVSDFKSVSYIRCDYDSGFNYAMLANIGSFIMKKEQFSEVIFWNSDMYLPDNSTLKELIARHRKNSPVLSGTKLLYPEKNWKGERFGVERKNGEVDYSVQGKVQYGGSGFSFLGNNLNFFHTKVGSEREDLYVNCDKGVNVNNGAYCMADLEWLYNAGGFNPSFAKIYNDIDICLRAISERKQIHYYGKDIFLYHEESTNLNSIGEEKKDHQFMSDMMLFSKIWNIANYDSVVRF